MALSEERDGSFLYVALYNMGEGDIEATLLHQGTPPYGGCLVAVCDVHDTPGAPGRVCVVHLHRRRLRRRGWRRRRLPGKVHKHTGLHYGQWTCRRWPPLSPPWTRQRPTLPACTAPAGHRKYDTFPNLENIRVCNYV